MFANSMLMNAVFKLPTRFYTWVQAAVGRILNYTVLAYTTDVSVYLSDLTSQISSKTVLQKCGKISPAKLEAFGRFVCCEIVESHRRKVLLNSFHLHGRTL